MKGDSMMKSIGKWLGGVIVLAVIMFVLPSLQTSASTTNFFQDGTCKDCSTRLYVGPTGNVYQIQQETSKINALNADGKKLWSYTFPKASDLLTAQSADAKGNFYIGVNGRYLASINAKGQLNWEFEIDQQDQGGPGAPIVGKDGTVYFGTGNYTDYIGPYHTSYFYAVTSTGHKKWSMKLNGDGYYASNYMDDKQNIVVETIGDENIWQYTISPTGHILSSKKILYTQGTYYIDNATNLLTATDKNGKKLWTYKVTSSAAISYVGHDGTVIVSQDGYMLSITKAKLNWKTKVTGEYAEDTKSGLYVINNDINWTNKTGKMYIYLLDMKTGKIGASTTLNFYTFNYEVIPNGYVLVSKDRTIYKVSLLKPQSAALNTKLIKVTNNKGKSDTVTVTGLKKGDYIKVYYGNTWVGKESTGSSVTLSIKQLGTKAGKVYVTVTRSGMRESGKVSVSYKGE